MTKFWVEKVPLVQREPLAVIAARAIDETLNSLEHSSEEFDIVVVDFCSGSGGPTPAIEEIVNRKRKLRGRDPIHFILSDLHPNIEDWIPLAEQSAHLSFIPQSVDARSPPASAMSDLALDANDRSTAPQKTKVFRLFCLSFHHFNDQEAMQILKNTMDTADGFAILELQERRISSIILMTLQFFFVFLSELFWFWHRPMNLLYTYVFPVLPFITMFDGIISSLRTHTFGELVGLFIAAGATKFDTETMLNSQRQALHTKGEQLPPLRIHNWTLKATRVMHTFPFGYMTWFVGLKN